MSSVMQEFTKGLWKDLPPFRLVLGLCPTLAVTNSANNGLGMGAAVIFVLVLSNMIISMVRGIIPKHMDCITAKLQEMGVEVEEQDDDLIVRRSGELRHANVKTLPYPGFPTDMQPQITTVLALASGTSTVTEGVWDSRYRYVGELTRMGAQIRVEGRTAIVEGVEKLTPANIQAYDLRAGAAMLIAALAADGVSEITNVQYIERGYEDIIGKLRALGARIDCVEENDEPPIRQIG